MVIKQFSDAMYGMGLEMIPTEGQFDPSVHEAISLEPVKEESKDGHIIETLRKGYKLAGRVMRAAQVVSENTPDSTGCRYCRSRYLHINKNKTYYISLL